MPLTQPERARYQRHLSLTEIGESGQEKLRAARVLVVGAGGLGSPAALYLAAAGVGTLGIVDCDRVELSNLQRQILFDTSSIGQPKANVASQRLAALNPDIEVVTHPIELAAANIAGIVSCYDVVLDGTDRLATRYLINDTCVILKKPLVSAAIHRFEGQAMTYVPGRGPCYRCLFPEVAEGLVPNCAEAGVLGVLPGVLGSIQATEAIKLVTSAGELLLGRLLVYDALAMRFNELRFARREDCAVCGQQPRILQPADSAAACASVASAAIRRLSASELRTELQQATQKWSVLRIIDVREPREYQHGHLPGAVNIPLSQLPRRAQDLSSADVVVFVCRSGGRSLAACELAVRAGIAAPVNLDGGLLAWARDIDPNFDVASVA